MVSSSQVENDGLSVTPYVGDGAVLLAFDLEEDKTGDFAGFAIQCVTPAKGPYLSNQYFLKNRLNFEKGLTRREKLAPEEYVDSDRAPFQTFHWVHFPGSNLGAYQYTVYASYFGNGGVKLAQKVTVKVDLIYRSFAGLELGFTRGYISSQAYADRFGNKPIRPAKKSIGFDTTPYQKQYEWLGAHARKLVFEFLQECQNDRSISVDVFAYDFDEPDIIDALCKMGSRARVFQDNAKLHTGPNAMEPKTVKKLTTAKVQVKTGHFNRFAHDKVMIQKKNGKAVKVLTGSANFSTRGLYVQANSILVFDDVDVATLYERAFEQAFTAAAKFKSSEIASKWYDFKQKNLPPASVSFAPHSTPFSLKKVSDAIDGAKSSVFFAVMQMGGGGPVLVDLEDLGARKNLFSLGTIQSKGQLKLFKPGIDANSAVTSFAFLKKNVPQPFKAEWGGGAGQVIHHKFVVCDFNGKSPIVFCGSSNLAAGGETSNGDNLIAISDEGIATHYAVEAIRLFDHYRFRSLHEQSRSNNPLMLNSKDDWVKPFYDSKNVKFRERTLLSLAA
jgi:phosphatidylserine/phosphatidylglycerophosphate/cardiolipin synthase-like enzyme